MLFVRVQHGPQVLQRSHAYPLAAPKMALNASLSIAKLQLFSSLFVRDFIAQSNRIRVSNVYVQSILMNIIMYMQ